jgi:hypothetical protein
MNKLLLYPILLMFILAGFNQIMAFSSGTTSIDLTYNNSQVIDSSGNVVENGTATQIATSSSIAVFDINMTVGLIALIISLVIVGVVGGIHFLGSGLSEFANKLIYNSTVYYGLWGIFSALAFTFFNGFPLGIGLFLWLGITIVYSFGFFETVWGGTS